MSAHLTVYVDAVLAREGGVVIISALPISADEWNKLPATDDTAMLDPTNGKQQEVAAGYKHFGVIAASKASAIELFYPSDATYTFNFLILPGEASSTPLTTERVGIGSTEKITDPASGAMMDWPSISVIAISGTERGANWARVLDDRFFDLTGPESYKYYRTTPYAGGRLIEITEDGIKKLAVEAPDE